MFERFAVVGAFGFGDTDGDHLRGVIPFVDRRRDVEAFVALQPDQPAAERLREHLGDLGLADAGLAFEENRPAHLERQVKHGAERAVGEIIGPGEEIDGGVDRGRQVFCGHKGLYPNGRVSYIWRSKPSIARIVGPHFGPEDCP